MILSLETKGCFDDLKPDQDARYSDKWTVIEFANLQNGAGLSLREFSRFLGFGEQTAARYEIGALPNLLHSNTLEMAYNPEGSSLYLNGEALSGESRGEVQS